jgi:hypothetical protein
MDMIIIPDEGMLSEIAAQLLELAEHPGQVTYVSWPQGGFSVPRELFERFEQARKDSEEQEEESPAPRKRAGRPRKSAVADTEDTQEEGS